MKVSGEGNPNVGRKIDVNYLFLEERRKGEDVEVTAYQGQEVVKECLPITFIPPMT